MKPSTRVVLGIRSVGDRAMNHIIESMPMEQAARKIVQFMIDSTMHQRFQFTLARTEEDALVGLGLAQTNKESKRIAKANEIANFLDEMFGDAPAHLPSPGQKQDQPIEQDESIEESIPTQINGLPLRPGLPKGI